MPLSPTCWQRAPSTLGWLSKAIAVFLPVLVTGPIALMRFLFGMFVGSLYLYAAVANLLATRALHPGLAVEGNRGFPAGSCDRSDCADEIPLWDVRWQPLPVCRCRQLVGNARPPPWAGCRRQSRFSCRFL